MLFEWTHALIVLFYFTFLPNNCTIKSYQWINQNAQMFKSLFSFTESICNYERESHWNWNNYSTNFPELLKVYLWYFDEIFFTLDCIRSFITVIQYQISKETNQNRNKWIISSDSQSSLLTPTQLKSRNQRSYFCNICLLTWTLINVVRRTEWDLALSCWDKQGHPWKSGHLKGSISCSRHLSALMVVTKMCKLPMPGALTHPHTITVPGFWTLRC